MIHLKFVAELITDAGIASPGIDLFIGTIPADVTRGVMLRDPLNGIDIDEGVKNFYAGRFQVVVRDPDVEAGYNRALDILGVLKIAPTQTSDITVSWMQPCTLPVSYPRGDADDMETSFFVDVGFGLP